MKCCDGRMAASNPRCVMARQVPNTPAVAQGLEGVDMEARPYPELQGGGEGPLDAFPQGEAQEGSLQQLPEAGHPGQHHGRQEHGQREVDAPQQQPPPGCQLCLPLVCCLPPAHN